MGNDRHRSRRTWRRAGIAVVAWVTIAAGVIVVLVLINTPGDQAGRATAATLWQGYLAPAAVGLTLAGFVWAWWRHTNRTDPTPQTSTVSADGGVGHVHVDGSRGLAGGGGNTITQSFGDTPITASGPGSVAAHTIHGDVNTHGSGTAGAGAGGSGGGSSAGR